MDEIGNQSANLGAGAARIGARPGKPKGHPKPPGSGRQKGTPNRITRDIREAAAKHSAKAIAELVRLLKDEDSRVRVAAARELLDRAHGKPISPTEISGKDGSPIETSDVSKIEVARRILNMIEEAKEASAGPRPIVSDPVDIEARRHMAFGLTLAAREAAQHDGEPMPTWYNSPAAPDPKPAQVIPPAPPIYDYEPTAEELARREFDAHINRASNRAIGGATSHPKVITQRPR